MANTRNFIDQVFNQPFDVYLKGDDRISKSNGRQNSSAKFPFDLRYYIDQFSNINNDGFPFYNIYSAKHEDRVDYRIVLALAGYSKEDISVTINEAGNLVITGGETVSSVDSQGQLSYAPNSPVQFAHKFDEIAEHTNQTDVQYTDWKLHRSGITQKKFVRVFELDSENSKVTKVRFIDGLLCIDVSHFKPVQEKPKTIKLAIE